MSGTLSQWGKAFSDFNNLEENRKKIHPGGSKHLKDRMKKQPWKFSLKKRKADALKIKDHISFTMGPSAWREVLAIEAQMRNKENRSCTKSKRE